MTVDTPEQLTPHQAKYYALDLSRRGNRGEIDAVGTALFDAQVDLNPHQIEAALVGFEATAERGRILADEVGLGKTIEAALVLCQRWAEGKRRLLVIAPAALRKQWAQELEEKFGLPALVVDRRHAATNPLDEKGIVVASYQYVARRLSSLAEISWDLIVVDEAHRLRNSHRSQGLLGQPLISALEAFPKLLLTATPLQNSLLELYGIVSVVDKTAFGEVSAFKSTFMRGTPDLTGLKERIAPTVHRTLRKAVLPYIQYTARRSLTWKFKSTKEEQALYDEVSRFLAHPDLFSLPLQQRGLLTMVLRKLLASSSRAIAGGLRTLRDRLEREGEDEKADDDLTRAFSDEGLDEEALEELAEILPSLTEPGEQWTRADEIAELDRLLGLALSIKTDSRARELLDALRAGFSQMETLGAAHKAVIFTESRRTQEWLSGFLEDNGYAGDVVCFNGSNQDPKTRRIVDAWQAAHPELAARASRAANVRAALIAHFRDQAKVLIATEAGAEGLNLQFASLVVNYDLPWNPQRVEQRIGRCHRYGQKHDVVVINFLDENNRADERVLELLTDKCQLFDGVFGASDEVLGAVESGVGLETKIHRIFRTCRTPEEIEAGFAALREEMDEIIRKREAKARKALVDHFDADVHERLRLRLGEARTQLDRIGRQFWALSRWALAEDARFDAEDYRFVLETAPAADIRPGAYELVSRGDHPPTDAIVYRVSHPLGALVLARGKAADTPPARVAFDITRHPLKVSVVEALRGKSGWLTLERMVIRGLRDEEHLLLSGRLDDGTGLTHEAVERLLSIPGRVVGESMTARPEDDLERAAARLVQARTAEAAERNQSEFEQTRARLERWADDQIRGAEFAITEIRHELRGLERKARKAETLEEQRAYQEQIAKVEARQRKARERVFHIEDEIRDKRRALLDELDRRVAQSSEVERVFQIAFVVE